MKDNPKRGRRARQFEKTNSSGFNTPLEKVLSRFPNAKPSGNGWSACCPAHDDKSPSLSISEGDEGRVLIRCHKGCPIDSICAALDLKTSDLMPHSGIDVDTNNPFPKEKRILSTSLKPLSQLFESVDAAIEHLERTLGPHSEKWFYHDADGELVGVILRWDLPDGKKTIRPVSKRGSSWVQEGMPGPRPLYRLPEIQHSDRVFVTEGEKAAEVIRSLGLPVTTSAHGSNSPKHTDWTALAGKDVFHLPDNDDPGREYADKVAQIVISLDPPARFKIVELPNLPESGDAFEWSESRDGADADTLRRELEELVDATEWYVPNNRNAGIEEFHKFPTDVLPEPVRGFIKACARAIHCDESYVALPVLACLASAIGNSHRIRLKGGWNEPAILWTAIVGDSGTMKSPAIQCALEPIRELQRKSFESHENQIRDFEADLARYERDFSSWKRSKDGGEGPPQKPKEPLVPRFWTDDTTIEALIELLGKQRRGLLMVRDELAGWFGFDRYSDGKGSEVSRWLEFHGGRPMMIDRKTGLPRQICIPMASVSVTGGIQPEILKSKLDSKNRQNGLAARLLLAWPPTRPKRWTEAEITEEIRRKYAELIERLYGLEMNQSSDGTFEPVILDLTPAGKQIWIDFYNQHGDQQAELSGDLSAAWSKLEGYAARFALIIHLCRLSSGIDPVELPDKVDSESIRAGIVLSRWFGNEARRIYSMLDEDEESRAERQLVELIRKRGGSITVRELMRSSSQWNKGTADAAETALNGLVRGGYGRWEVVDHNGERGRPSRRFVLHDVDTNSENSE